MNKRTNVKETKIETTMTENQQPKLVPQDKNLINVYDVNTVKYTLDTAVAEIVTSQTRMQPDNFISNLRIILGAIACSCAVAAYFNTSHRNIIILCGIYFICGGIVQFFTYFYEKNSILLTKPLGNSAIKVQSEFKPPKYTITVTNITNANAGGLGYRYTFKGPNSQFTKTWPVNELFDERGALVKDRLSTDIATLLKFDRKQ